MATLKSVSHVGFAHFMVVMPLVIAAIAIAPVPAVAQGVDSNLSQQLSQLQAQVTRLEAALNHQPQAAAPMTPQPNSQSNQATLQAPRIPGVPDGMQIMAGYQNCVQCHQTRPTGPLPPSHLVTLSVGGQGGTEATGGQESSGGGMGQMAQGGQGNQGMGGGQGMQGMDGGKGKGMGMMGGGMGMGGDKKMGMGGDKGMGMMGGGGMGMMGGGMSKGDSSQDSQSMNAMGGGGSMGGSVEKPMESQMQQMQQQIQQLQQQMQQMMQVQMQMQLIQMKAMQSN